MNPVRAALIASVAILMGCGGEDEMEISLADHLAQQANQTKAAVDAVEEDSTLVPDLASAVREEETFMQLSASNADDDEIVEDVMDPTIAGLLIEDQYAPAPPSGMNFNQAAVASIDALVERMDAHNKRMDTLTQTVGDDRLAVATMLRELNKKVESLETPDAEPVSQDLAPHEIMPVDLADLDMGSEWASEINQLQTNITQLAEQAQVYSNVLATLREAAPEIRRLASDFPEVKEMADDVLKRVPRQPVQRKPQPSLNTPPSVRFIDDDRIIMHSQTGIAVTLLVGRSTRVDGKDVELLSTNAGTGTASIKVNGKTVSASLSA